MYLRAWNTQENIAKEINIDQATVSRIINNMQKVSGNDLHKDFNPFLYNIWNTLKGNETMNPNYIE